MKKKTMAVMTGLLMIAAVAGFAGQGHAGPLPGTGQTKCYNNVGEIPCPAPGEAFYSQDGNYTINPPLYTKLDASGNALPDDAPAWAMVRDNVTGLIWENKTNDGSIHDGSKTFTWCDRNPATNGGYQGFCGTGTVAWGWRTSSTSSRSWVGCGKNIDGCPRRFSQIHCNIAL